MTPHTWSVRVSASGRRRATVHGGKISFAVGGQVTFDAPGEIPTAVEYLLGALSADLVLGFQLAAERRRIELDALEMAATCRLNNPLVHLGVIGEQGHPGIEEVSATLFVSGDLDQAEVDACWTETLARSPLFNTLSRSVTLSLRVALA